MQQKMDYEPGDGVSTASRTWRLVIGSVIAAVALPITFYFGVGTLFVWGAVEQGTYRSVSSSSVWIMVAYTLGGMGMSMLGLVLITRAIKTRSPRNRPAA